MLFDPFLFNLGMHIKLEHTEKMHLLLEKRTNRHQTRYHCESIILTVYTEGTLRQEKLLNYFHYTVTLNSVLFTGSIQRPINLDGSYLYILTLSTTATVYSSFSSFQYQPLHSNFGMGRIQLWSWHWVQFHRVPSHYNY